MENRNKTVRGSVVRSLKGRDRDRIYVAVAVTDRCVFAADGKSRKLGNPKCKNVKHISPSEEVIDLTDMTDKKLRRLLFLLNNPGQEGEKDDRA